MTQIAQREAQFNSRQALPSWRSAMAPADLARSEQDWRDIQAQAFDAIEQIALRAAQTAYDAEINRGIEIWWAAALAYRDRVSQ